MAPSLCATRLPVLSSITGPYFALLVRLVEDAHSKYSVRQEPSPILNRNMTACAMIWLSKIESSGFSSNASVSSNLREVARNRVWYSESLNPEKRFWKAVRNLLANYLQVGLVWLSSLVTPFTI